MSRTSKRFLIAAVGFVAIAGVAAPLTASAVTANTTITATVNPTITVASTGAVSFILSPTATPVESRASDTVTVNTNDVLGYTLTLADSDAVTNLASGANTIGASAGTFAVPTTFTILNKWGYAMAGGNFSGSYTALNNDTTFTDKWAGVPATGSPQTLKTTAVTATNDTTTVWYGARVDSTQPSGTTTPYTDTVTYTATAN